MEERYPTDPDLLQRARQFEPQALAAIYDAYSPGLHRYALRLLGDDSTAEDCVADTFARLLEAFQSGSGPRDFLKAYLYRVAHNWISDHYRRGPAAEDELDEEHPDGGADLEQAAGMSFEQERLREALRLLTPEQRQVVTLKYLEGWENEEIARSLKKPVGAIKSLQHRALAALQRELNVEDQFNGHESRE